MDLLKRPVGQFDSSLKILRSNQLLRGWIRCEKGDPFQGEKNGFLDPSEGVVMCCSQEQCDTFLPTVELREAVFGGLRWLNEVCFLLRCLFHQSIEFELHV